MAHAVKIIINYFRMQIGFFNISYRYVPRYNQCLSAFVKKRVTRKTNKVYGIQINGLQ